MARPLQVIYEDNHLIIVNKSNGMLVQGDHTGDKPLNEYVKAYIKEKYNKSGEAWLGTVHRLDRPVSGAVVFGRTSKGAERMSELFRKREIQKVYWAIVARRPPSKKGRLVHWLHKDNKKNVVTAYEYEVEHGQKAVLTYRTVGKLNNYYLLEVEPVTGRSHQIRVQLAAIGCPIKGDIKYGYPKPHRHGKAICLHARRLYFEHPVKKEKMLCVASLPDDAFWQDFLAINDEKVKPEHLIFRYEA
ncbi:MAG: RluA family pseudouridine synthase [Bacteroidota bacterium]